MQTYVCALAVSAEPLCLHFIVCDSGVACLYEAKVMTAREDIQTEFRMAC